VAKKDISAENVPVVEVEVEAEDVGAVVKVATIVVNKDTLAENVLVVVVEVADVEVEEEAVAEVAVEVVEAVEEAEEVVVVEAEEENNLRSGSLTHANLAAFCGQNKNASLEIPSIKV